MVIVLGHVRSVRRFSVRSRKQQERLAYAKVVRDQARAARRIILATGWRDYERCETISRVSRMDVLNCLPPGPVQISAVPDVEKGEVLIDSRGQGSFQR